MSVRGRGVSPLYKPVLLLPSSTIISLSLWAQSETTATVDWLVLTPRLVFLSLVKLRSKLDCPLYGAECFRVLLVREVAAG